jgi:hypothetical protein
MEEILWTLGIGLVAAVKYMVAVVGVFAQNYTGLEGFVIVTIGGVIGVMFFTYLSDKINGWLKNYTKRRKKRGFLRFLVKLRRNYGLVGVSILTPIILSIPLGCYLAKTFTKSNNKIVLYMSVSIILWGILIFGAKTIFNINIMSKI